MNLFSYSDFREVNKNLPKRNGRKLLEPVPDLLAGPESETSLITVADVACRPFYLPPWFSQSSVALQTFQVILEPLSKEVTFVLFLISDFAPLRLSLSMQVLTFEHRHL